MSRPRRFLVDAEHGQLQVTAVGSGDVDVVLLHHAPASSACWAQLLPELARRGRTAWAVDLPGYGGSDPPDCPIDGVGPELESYAELVAAVLATAPRPVALVGRQTGAAVAAALAVRHPDRVAALVLWGYPDFDEPLRSALATERTSELGADLVPLHQFVTELRSHDRNATIDAPGADPYVRRAIADYLVAGVAQHWAHNAIGRADLGALAAAIEQPTLLVYDRARADLPQQQYAAQRTFARLRYGELCDLSGVASSLDIGSAGALAEVIVRFATRPVDAPHSCTESYLVERKTE